MAGPRSWETRKPETLAKRRRAIAEGGGACTCCGEPRFEFLTVEHLLVGDRSDRSSTRMLRRAARHGFDGRRYTILCANCNSARANFGQCPHERERPAAASEEP